ncbi:CHASE2 domain-containing protein [Vitiosangium sp. GDMCC 1.1324]|uniref:CHASE2 domain-containing protein n=1 Tax=Vitiosangium sp. (strain GDMCC 1.1324) TaxID=2138576 RepID=UPI000D34DBA1|nr:adenylate/guanylate cyclase domain-containing protein [Vitiosangium sp. GDMCC 1.1324]PTL78782.1 adenylate/guanylate cyclase domain-containing protein [Vitiosangium sp. GDMCC 1.1324]
MESDTWKILLLRLRHHLPQMLGVAVLSTAVAAACWLLGWLGLPALERALYDRALTTFTRSRGLSPDIVVVAIDQTSLNGVRDNPTYARDFGTYPWNRGLWARVMEELAHHGARAVLFDGVMDERSTGAEPDFARVLRDTGLPVYLGVATHPRAAPLPKVDPVHPPPAQDFGEVADPMAAAQVLAFPVRTDGRALPLLESEPLPEARQPNHLIPPATPLLAEAKGFGLVEVEPDPDGLIRRTRFAYTDGVNAYVTLPVVAAADLFGARELVFSGRTMRLGSRELEVNPDGSAELDFGGSLHERFPIVPVVTLLDAWTLRKDRKPTGLKPDLFRGRVVVIGRTAVEELGGARATPFGAPVPGVSKQLAVMENLLSGRFITEAPFWVSLLFGLGLAVVSAVLLMTVRMPELELAWLLLVVVPIVFLVMGASLALGRVHLLAAMPAAAGLLACLGAMASNHLFANREAAFIRQAFSRYMEPRLIEQMIEENRLPRLDGEERELTAFFSDIRGFSSFSETFQDQPRELVRVLNQYLTRVSSALLHEGGCLDKYIGDAVVCLFGAPVNHPDHAVRACRGALAAQAEVNRLRAEFRKQGLPDVYTRIGLNSARLFVGNFGSEQLFDYTAMGDGMNLASRLEGANKAYGSLIMIGPRTYELARDHIEVRELDRVRVAGKEEAVTVYELLALKGELPAEKLETVERYHEALALYRQARFAEAAKVLEARLAEDLEDGPTAALLSRCRKYQQHPPPLPFDGVANLEK